jgi:nucleotide-binding universal stress UspA family protein
MDVKDWIGFCLEAVSHAVVQHVTCPVLVIR